MQGGGRSLPQNLTQGGKTFGLNWLECLNSNGLPSLNKKFKDLNLQLHASTTVTNPYTFNIRGNCSFSASVESAVPDTTTILGSNYASNPNYFTSVSVTIPNGVNVILVRGTGEIFIDHTGDQYAADLGIGRIDGSNRIIKVYSIDDGVSYSYVKVTPGKVYNIGIYGSDSINGDDEYVSNLYLEVCYSKTINNTTPTVIDL